MSALPPLWRVFPWDRDAEDGRPCSASFVPAVQGMGRFDLPGVAVRYLAESPEHAVAERIQGFRGQLLEAWDLTDGRRPLALVSVHLASGVAEGIADGGDPAVLVRLDLRPEALASRDLARSQAVAAAVHAAGHSGLRWWSALHGDWHATVLFGDRAPPGALRWGHPEVLTLAHPAVEAACAALAIRRFRVPRRGRPPRRG